MTTLTHKYAIGDTVTCPAEDCGGCWPNRPSSFAGQVVGFTSERPDSDIPGPYYLVLLDHEHNGGGGGLIYGESELTEDSYHCPNCGQQYSAPYSAYSHRSEEAANACHLEGAAIPAGT